MRTRGRVGPVALLSFVAAVAAAGADFAQSTASLPAQKTPAAGDAVVPVLLTPADGVSGMDLVVSYDPAIAKPAGAFTTGFTGAFVLVPELDGPNRVRLSLSGPVLTGAGEVAWILFRAVGQAPAPSTLGWGACSLNSGVVSCTTVNGVLDLASAAVTVYAPDDARGAPGASVDVPIAATAFSGVESIDLTLQFDPGVLAATSVSKTTLTAGLSLTYNVGTPGVARISLFGTAPISGSGPLVTVTFQVVGGLSKRTPLDLRGVLLNEGSPSTLADDGLFLACTAADGDGDLQSSCDGDCNDADPSVFRGATEICDGIDNDCSGFVDDAPPPGGPLLSVSRQGTATVLSWGGVYLATAYDAVRGALGTLRATSGDFSSATDACLANDTTATTVDDPGVLPPGDGSWYVVRAVDCGGAGTYDDGSARQSASRDAGIAQAPVTCP